MRRLLIGLLLCVGLWGGCTTSMDEKEFLLQQQWHSASADLVVASNAFVAGSDVMAVKKHSQQEKAINAEWDRWIKSHTDENGGLVSSNEAGETIPMPVTQILLNVAKREKAMLDLETSQRSWLAFKTEFQQMLASFDVTNKLIQQEGVDLYEARQSMQLTAERISSVIGSAIGGIALGVGL